MTNQNPSGEINTNNVVIQVAIANQLSQNSEEAIATNESLRSNSVYATCATCKNTGPTKCVRNLNVLNLIYSLICTPCWTGGQSFKVKDYNCFNADHHCRCGALIGRYEAC